MIYQKHLSENIIPVPKDIPSAFVESFEVGFQIPLLFYIFNKTSNSILNKNPVVCFTMEELYKQTRRVSHLKKSEAYIIIEAFLEKLSDSDIFNVTYNSSDGFEDIFISCIFESEAGVKLIWLPSYLSVKNKKAKALYIKIMFYDDRKEGFIYYNSLMKILGISGNSRKNQRRSANNAFSSLVGSALIEYYDYKNKKGNRANIPASSNNYVYSYKLTSFMYQRDFSQIDKSARIALSKF